MGPVLARVLLVVTSALWGLTFIANHELLTDLDAVQISLLRFLAVSVIFLGIFAAVPSLRPTFTRRDWLIVAVSGLLAVPGAQLSVVNGQRYLAPAFTGIVVATGPAIMALLSVVILRERMRISHAVGFALALAGAVVIIVLGSGSGTDLTVRNPWGASLVVLGQVSWGLYTILSKPFAARQQPITAVGTVVIAGTVWMFPLVPHALEGLPLLHGAQWFWLFGHLVFGGTVFAYLIYFASLKPLDANKTGAYLNLVPFFVFVWSTVILGLPPEPLAIAGGAVVIVGVVLTQRASRPVIPSEVFPAGGPPPSDPDPVTKDRS
jgi:drug/metabolite transporter (DMT)-like permease